MKWWIKMMNPNYQILGLCFFFFINILQVTLNVNVAASLQSTSVPDRINSLRTYKSSKCLQFSLSDSIQQYYKFTNLASRAIYINKFREASLLYDSAFTFKSHPFYEDLINYILVNGKSNLHSKNKIVIDQLITGKKIDTITLFNSIPRRNFDQKNIDQINKLIEEQKSIKQDESPLQSSLREIFVIDQDVRDYENINDSNKEELYIRRDLVDFDNYKKFVKLIKTYGFPSEGKTGVYYDDELKWSEVIYTLLSHFLHLKNDETKLNTVDIVLKSVFSGEYPASKGATLLDVIDLKTGKRISGYNFLNTTVFLVNGSPFRPFVFYSDSLMKAVNTNRLSMGLDSFHITQAHVICQFFGSQDLGTKKIILMEPFAELAEFPYGLVKSAVDEAKHDMNTYKINTTKILTECDCRQKVY